MSHSELAALWFLAEARSNSMLSVVVNETLSGLTPPEPLDNPLVTYSISRLCQVQKCHFAFSSKSPGE